MSLSRLLKNKTAAALIKVVLALVVMGYLAYAVEPREILATARGAHIGWIACAAALLPVNLWLEGQEWKRVLRPVAPHVPGHSLYGALLCGYAFGFFTPMHAGAFAGRALYLPHTDGWETSVTVFVQCLLDMVVSVTIGLAALLFALTTSLFTPSPAWWAAAGYGAGTMLILTVLLLRPESTLGLLRRVISSKKVCARLAFLERLAPADVVRTLGLALLRYVIYTSQFVCLLYAFSPSLHAVKAYLGTGLTFFAKFLIPSLTILDIGVREGASVFFFGRLGVPEAAAFNAAFLLFCLNLLVPAAAGLPSVLRLRLARTGLRIEKVED